MSDTQTAMVIEAVTHYKRKLLRHANDEKGDVVLHCLAKLDRVPMTIEILQETGVGRIVNQLKKSTDPDSQIADEAKNIVRKWKEIVQTQEEEEERMNVEPNAPDSNRDANTEDDGNTSSGPEDLEEAKSVPQEDSGSDIGPPTLEPQIDSPPSKKHKSSKHSSSSKDKKRDKDSSEKSRDSKSHKSKKRDDESKHKNHKEDKSHSRSDREKKSGKEDKNKEHKSKSKSSKSSHELKHSRDASKEDHHRKNGHMEKNGISKSSSSHHRDKLPRSSESNSFSSANNPKKKDKNKDKSPNTSQLKPSSENKGMFESAMLGADDLLTHKKTSKHKTASGELPSGYSNNSFADPTIGKMNGESTNGNSLVNAVNVPKDINPNYKPTADNWSDRASHPSSTSTKQNVKLPTFDSEIYSGKKKSGQTRVYSGAGRRFEPIIYELSISFHNNINSHCYQSNINLSIYLTYRSGFTDVPKLYDLCILVLQENVDSIDECGGLSYHILEPILTRAKPNILMNIEDHNEYLLEDTGMQIIANYFGSVT